VLNKLKHNAAPINIHHGLLDISALKSEPTDTTDVVFKCSRVNEKQQINNTKHAAAITIIASCQQLSGDAPMLFLK
jgi:phage/plasmid-associated DNA primase